MRVASSVPDMNVMNEYGQRTRSKHSPNAARSIDADDVAAIDHERQQYPSAAASQFQNPASRATRDSAVETRVIERHVERHVDVVEGRDGIVAGALAHVRFASKS